MSINVHIYFSYLTILFLIFLLLKHIDKSNSGREQSLQKNLHFIFCLTKSNTLMSISKIQLEKISSDQATRFQSSTIQWRCWLVQLSHNALCCAVNYSTRVGLRIRNPKLMMVRWTVCMLALFDTPTLKSVAIWENVARLSPFKDYRQSILSTYSFDRIDVGHLMFLRKPNFHGILIVVLQIPSLSHRYCVLLLVRCL